MDVYDTANENPAESSITLPIGGRVRAGKKRLTPAAQKAIPNAQKMLEEGEQGGMSYDEIEKFLIASTKGEYKRRPLVPVNTPQFRINRDDFMNHANADVFDQWKEDRGDGLQLYQFPVVFPVDEIDKILSWGFSCYRGSKLKYWRDGEGQCVELPDPVKGKRQFGKRQPVVRKNVCDPNDCEEFAAEECNHVCNLYFYVPGHTGVGYTQLSFRSIYARVSIAETLQTVKRGLGRISGTFGGQPMFWVTKRQEEKPRLDYKTGTTTKTKQWFITLDARGIDMMQFFIASESNETAGLLVHADESKEPSAPAQNVTPMRREQAPQPKAQTEEPPAKDADAKKAAEPVKASKAVDKLSREYLFGLAKSLSINPTVFGQWATKMYGREAFGSEEKRKLILDRLQKAEKTGDVSEWGTVTDETVPF